MGVRLETPGAVFIFCPLIFLLLTTCHVGCATFRIIRANSIQIGAVYLSFSC